MKLDIGPFYVLYRDPGRSVFFLKSSVSGGGGPSPFSCMTRMPYNSHIMNT